ncbi:MAG: acyltransferase, partial [Gemmataceae bacterium]|nr:acyltransferase [Gemmataceae bacterium]
MDRPPTDAPKPGSRIPALDALRAVAILWVVLLHLALAGYLPAIASPFLQKLVMAGDIGVDLFFVLSGYLIASIMLGEFADTGGLRLGRFWHRRWMRTLPAYYATLALVALGDLAHRHPVPWSHAWSYLFFLQTSVLGAEQVRFG